jgi:hypothetical protein
MATLKKMTRMGADVRQIARLLQAKAPENHMLAYITPEEAQMLKDRGGSGKPHADTGIPSFEDEGYGFTQDTAYDIGNVRAEPAPQVFSQPDYSQQAVSGTAPTSSAEPAPVDYSVYTRGMSAEPASQEFVPGAPVAFEPPQFRSLPPAMTGASIPTTFDTTPEKGIMQRLTEATGMKEDTLARLGIGGLQAVLGARTARKAAEQGRQGKAETQAIAQPYQAKGAELQRAAQAGELTPQSQQALQAVQAQVAQQATARGGVGTMQSQAQVEAFRQQLLAQQYDYGLKLSGIGDQIALGAIKTGLQADQSVNELTSSYYNNIARSLLPQPAQQVVTRG